MSLTPAFQPLGKHRIRLQEDVVIMEAHGEISLEEAREMCALQGPHCIPLGYSLGIIDATDGIHMSAEARRYFAEWMKEHRLPNYSVIIGANFMVRTLGTLFANAVRIVTSQEAGLHFCRSEAEAWEVIPEKRKGLLRAAAERKKTT